MLPGSLFLSDEDLLRRLPLPLAQLGRRAFNAKSPLERHQASYYLWEASLKLLGCAAVAEWGEDEGPRRDLFPRIDLRRVRVRQGRARQGGGQGEWKKESEAAG